MFGVIIFVRKKLPADTFKFPNILSVMLAKLVKRKDPEFVAKTLKFPAIIAPFNPPNRFNEAVCAAQFHVKFPKVCESPPVAPVLVVYPMILQLEVGFQVAVGITPAIVE